MLLIRNVDSFRKDPAKPLVLILGNFDGVHAGHQRLIARGLAEARDLRGEAALFTFRIHPQCVLHPASCPQMITGLEQKISLIEELGIRKCFLVEFTAAFSEMSAAAFVEEVLVGKLGVNEVCIGHNARFGHDRKGDSALMKSLSLRFGFRFKDMDMVRIGGEVASSTRIRGLIRDGNLEQAKLLLTRPFRIAAQVTPGDGRGKTLGFPTANLDVQGLVMPPQGVYAVRARQVRCDQREETDGSVRWDFERGTEWREGVLNFGVRPTFSGNPEQPVAEVHLLNYQDEMNPRTLEVEFHARIRGEQRFRSAEELKRQIALDIEVAKRLLTSAERISG